MSFLRVRPQIIRGRVTPLLQAYNQLKKAILLNFIVSPGINSTNN